MLSTVAGRACAAPTSPSFIGRAASERPWPAIARWPAGWASKIVRHERFLRLPSQPLFLPDVARREVHGDHPLGGGLAGEAAGLRATPQGRTVVFPWIARDEIIKALEKRRNR